MSLIHIYIKRQDYTEAENIPKIWYVKINFGK